MTPIYFALFIISLGIGVVHGDGDQKIIMNRVEVTHITGDNPFFGKWEAQLHSSGQKLSLKMPVKQELPDSIRFKLEMTLDGDDLPEVEMSLCEAFDDDSIGKDITEHGAPDGQFPKECPIYAGDNLEIRDYTFPDDKIPPGTQDGPLHSILRIFEEGKEGDPIIIIESDGEITH
ncbi:uncharacterized protein [Fopius arisanus]|uniref:Uncharacterized protein n=1 Tax=Fopius arisanus TaxID=64838 RepID=A0A9R1T6F8_9HYME|nr:PREDICTED: uncharacterized protein LOC105266673 [Fopius arisanus]